MDIGIRKIIADHYFKRYFDLGVDFPGVFPGESLHSQRAIQDVCLGALVTRLDVHKLMQIADRIFDFTKDIPLFALERLSSNDFDYRTVVNDFDYTLVGSRYDIFPNSLRMIDLPIRAFSSPEATESESRKCYECAVDLWHARTCITSKAEAFEAIRRGKASLPSR